MQLVIGISGATGAIYGIRVLEVLQRTPDVETHLVISKASGPTISHETGYTIGEVKALASVVYDDRDLGAAISSGSFQTDGMLIAPCSVKTLSGIANSYDENLMVRAADVVLKERRKLVLMVRETPLHLGHLRLMVQAVEQGAMILSPVPAFYNLPTTLDDIVNQSVGRALDQFGIDAKLFTRWKDSGVSRKVEKS
jgi:4-hydroxy-3-polyprenylbenzoate decarboxylase